MKNPLVHWLQFSKTERSGAVLLTLICLCAANYTVVLPYFQPAETHNFKPLEETFNACFEPVQTPETGPVLFCFNPNTVSSDSLVLLGLPEKTARTIVRYRERGGYFKSATDLRKIYSLKASDYQRLEPWIKFPAAKTAAKPVTENFPFDPNTAMEGELARLGLPAKTIKNILRYREKGGHFRTPADFGKIYDMPPERFRELEPFIQITQHPPAAANAGAGFTPKFSKKIPVENVDINQSDDSDWQQLPGIGAARSGQILRFRDKLGGFSSIGQVAETRGLPDSVFRKIVPFLQYSPPFRLIDLNHISQEELALHPYFSYKQAALIIAYREQHGPYKAVSDVAKILPLNDPAWLEKIRPYLLLR